MTDVGELKSRVKAIQSASNDKVNHSVWGDISRLMSILTRSIGDL